MIADYTQSIATLVGLWFVPVGIAFSFAWATNHAPDWSARWYAAGQTGLSAGAVGAACSAVFPYLAGQSDMRFLALAMAMWGTGGILIAPWAFLLLGPPVASAIRRRRGGALTYALAGAAIGAGTALVWLRPETELAALVGGVAGIFGAALSLGFHLFETGGD